MAFIPVVGVTLCGARGHVRWPNNTPGRRHYTNFDAVFFFHCFGFPLIPIRAAHIYRHTIWNFEREYEWHPIRWTVPLVLLAWIRRSSQVLIGYALVLLLFAVFAIAVKNDPAAWVLLEICVAALIMCPILLGVLRWRDQRNREIRRIMGNSRFGSGDPITYDRKWVAGTDFATANPLYGCESFGEGAMNCIKNHNWWGAMFAARMCILMEDSHVGHQLTQIILDDAEVRDSLMQVRAHPDRWHDLLGPGRYERRE